jgi:hypothetical protein
LSRFSLAAAAKINQTDAIGEDDDDEKDSGFVFDDI